MADGKGGICSLCGKPYEGWGNSARPFKGTCCDHCNIWKVLPARMGRPADDLHLDQLEELMNEQKEEGGKSGKTQTD
jgi:hypothetical protein